MGAAKKIIIIDDDDLLRETKEGRNQQAGSQFSLFGDFNGIAKNADKTEGYIVPLADRKLVEVSKVKMLGVNMAQVDYKWKWQPNKMGDLFDANSKVIDSFKIWDRTTLIQKYGVDFYHGEPKMVSLTFQRDEKSWKPYSPY